VFQAIGAGTTAAELGRRLGVSKQAARTTLAALEPLGYVEFGDDPADARRRLLRLTARGEDVLPHSAEIFDALRAEWARALGADRLRALEADLRAVTGDRAPRLDVPGWFGA
jgi:DNA-binding MarR family transcriptional regulator